MEPEFPCDGGSTSGAGKVSSRSAQTHITDALNNARSVALQGKDQDNLQDLIMQYFGVENQILHK